MKFSKSVFSSTGTKVALLACLLLAFSTLGAQDKKVALSERTLTVREAFRQMENQTGYNIAFDATVLNTSRSVTLSRTEGTAKEILTLVLAGTGQTFDLRGNYIVLRAVPQQPAAQASVAAAAPVAPAAPAPAPAVPVRQADLPAAEAATPAQSLAAPSVAPAAPAAESPAAPSAIVWQGIPAVAGSSQAQGFGKQRLPLLSVKTNLLDAAATSINLGFEVRLSDQWTLHLPVSYNPWKFSDNKQWRHLSVAPEGRFWLSESFNGHFFGVHGLYSYFNAGNLDLPLGVFPDLENYRYEGNLFGAGLSYGYQWILGKRWGMEATLGVGYFYADYKQYDCATCGQEIGKGYKHYFGPTKAGVSLIFFIK